MWKEKYDQKQLKVTVELSTYCNARCPQCSRTDHKNKLKKVDWLPLEHWTYEQFSNRFKDDIEHISVFNFGGNYGDPGMCPDLLEIAKWIMDNSNARIIMQTNMAMRKPKFWKELADYCKDRLKITCAVHGYTNEMHQIYRRGCELDKVVANFKAAASCERETFTVFFAHNWPYKDEILAFCKSLGADRTQYIESNRFHEGDVWTFQDEDGIVQEYRRIPKEEKEEVFVTNIIATSRCRQDHEIKAKRLAQTTPVTCRKGKIGSLFIDAKGYIYPCCHFSGMDPRAKYRNLPKEIWDRWEEGMFILGACSLKEFIESEWVENLIKSLTENPLDRCKIKCGNYANTLTED